MKKALQTFWEKAWRRANAQKNRHLWQFYPLALLRAYREERLAEYSQALVYVTLLTLVPLLAVAFALLRGFGVSGIIEPWLRDIFAPMGSAGAQVVNQLLDFVNQTKASSLGIIGVFFLFVSVMNLAQKLEITLNRIWQIDTARSLSQRIVGYLSAVILAPLLIGAIVSSMLGMKNAAWLQPYLQYSGVQILFSLITSILPVIVILLIISALYAWTPNRRVKWYAALGGALFFLALWYPISWLFSRFIAGSQNYSAIYSSFASAIILLIWLNFLWLIFLLGAKFASLLQLKYLLAPDNDNAWYAGEQVELGIALLSIIGNQFQQGKSAPTEDDLLNQLPAQPYKIHYVLRAFTEANLIIVSAENPEHYLPSKSLDLYHLQDIYQSLRVPDKRYVQQAPQIEAMEAKIAAILREPLYVQTENNAATDQHSNA